MPIALMYIDTARPESYHFCSILYLYAPVSKYEAERVVKGGV
jgi:hypothetical protein